MLNRRVPAGPTVRSRRVERVVLAMALAWIGLANVGRIVLMGTLARIGVRRLGRLIPSGCPAVSEMCLKGRTASELELVRITDRMGNDGNGEESSCLKVELCD
jgi:hypothetical protein